MTETEKAWLAGFFDGEGTVASYIRKGHPYYSLTFHNTHRNALVYAAEIIGCGTLQSRTRSPDNKIKSAQTQYVLRIYASRDVAHVLRQMRPYLRIKDLAADTALAVLEPRLAEIPRARIERAFPRPERSVLPS